MANEPVDTNEKKEPTPVPDGNADFEARVKALEAENAKLRQANSNASAEASRYKKQLQEKMTEDEKAKAAREEAEAARQTEIEQLRHEVNVAKYTAALSASDIGMDAETAKEVAEALNAGETEKVFDGIRRFVAVHDKELHEAALKNNPTLPGGESTKTVTKEEFKAMNLTQMLAFKVEHPDLYAEYTK